MATKRDNSNRVSNRGRNFLKSPDAVTEFEFKPRESLAPQGYTDLDKPETKNLLGDTIGHLRKAFLMKPVQSNAELLERLDDYFDQIQNRAIPPTVEELGLYCGYTSETLRAWRSGMNKGFRDEPLPGISTKLIAKKALEMVHATDAVLTESGKMNPVTYIFRSKNYYGMSDRQEIVVSASADDSNEPLTPEEIAKNLPEPDEFMQMDVDADYTIE